MQPVLEPLLQRKKAWWGKQSGQDKRNLGMSHPENDRDPCAWFPLGLSLLFWEVGAYPGTWPGCWLGGRS